MPSYTTKGYPYITGSESASTIDDYALELANKLNGVVPFAMAAGSGTVAFSASENASVTITLPASRFSVAPVIYVAINDNSAPAKAIPRARNITSSTFDIQCRTGDGTSVTGNCTVAWFAVQFLSNAAAG